MSPICSRAYELLNSSFNYEFSPKQINPVSSIVAREYRVNYDKSATNFFTDHKNNIKKLKRFYGGRKESKNINELFEDDKVRLHKSSMYQKSDFHKKGKTKWSVEEYTVSKINPQTNMYYISELKKWFHIYDLLLILT